MRREWAAGAYGGWTDSMATSPSSHASMTRRLPHSIAIPNSGSLSDSIIRIARFWSSHSTAPAYAGKWTAEPSANPAMRYPCRGRSNCLMRSGGSVKWKALPVSTMALIVSVRSGSRVFETVRFTRGSPVIMSTFKQWTLPLIIARPFDAKAVSRAHVVHHGVAYALCPGEGVGAAL